MDGSGYPDGLAGEDIPLPARTLHGWWDGRIFRAFEEMIVEAPESSGY